MQFKHVIGQTQPARLGRMEIAETSTHRSPLKIFGVSPTDRVGVVGSGGLGHLALTFALVARLPLSLLRAARLTRSTPSARIMSSIQEMMPSCAASRNRSICYSLPSTSH